MDRLNLLGIWLVASLLAFASSGCGAPAGGDKEAAVQHLSEAQKAIAAGDTAGAMTLLQASIDAQPNVWAYLERAKLNAKEGKDQEALADCEEILKLHPENRDVTWIKAELKKPADKRFQTAPPSMKK